MFLCESTLRKKTRLARAFAYVFGLLDAKALVPHGQRPLAPAAAIGIEEMPGKLFSNAPFAQLMTDFQRTLPSRHPLDHEILCEASIGKKILGFERVQRLADQALGETPRGELAAQLGARVLAAGQ